MSKIQIVYYGKKWEESHQKFAKKYYNNRRKRVIPEYIYWKFRSKKEIDTELFLLAISDNEVVGQLGLIPCRIILKSKVFDAHWACDLMVDKKFRGKGIAPSLYTEAMRKKILFLCTGNSCRSQMAEGFAKNVFSKNIYFESAGTRADGLNPYTVNTMNEIGIDISHHKSKKININDIDKFDLVITLCGDAKDKCPVLDTKNIYIGIFLTLLILEEIN